VITELLTEPDEGPDDRERDQAAAVADGNRHRRLSLSNLVGPRDDASQT
jgi:hypothetical protein